MKTSQNYLFFCLFIFATNLTQALETKDWDDLEFKDLDKIYFKKTSAEKAQKRKASSADENVITPDYQEAKAFLHIRDPEVLEKLEKKGFDLLSQFANKNSQQENVHLSDLYSSQANYRFLADTLKKDLEQLIIFENQQKSLPQAGVGMGFSRRVFDANWFKSVYAQFELVGIVNRIDRTFFTQAGCGETRFVYRLSYLSKNKATYSRMPMTLMVKYANTGNPDSPSASDYCAEMAKKWVYPKNLQSNADLVNWLISEQGPLHASQRQAKPQSFEVNLQAMRIPSKARPDLAGHGSYLLRSFNFDEKYNLQEGPLENTPDVGRINDPAQADLKKDFIKQFKNPKFINRLSEGLLVLDEKYLAKKAWSYSPYGLGRKSNRLFDQIITEDDLKEIQFNQSSYVKSARAAIMRLNDLSCVGCHQGRAHAGFHFLGVDKKENHPLNSVFFEGSGHFELELKRRTHFMRYLTEGKGRIPDPARDFSISPGEDFSSTHDRKDRAFNKSGYGHYCGLPGGSFTHWQCEQNLKCQIVDEPEGQKELGKCFPEKAMAGDPVRYGQIVQSDYHTDQLKSQTVKSCGSLEPKVSFGVFDISGGFPSAVCYRRSCSTISKASEIETCADSAGAGFNECIAQTANGQITFAQCLEKTMIHLGFSKCHQERSCRNDFVCARSMQKEGYCTPSYFLFQVRLDGHINPVKGL